MMFKNGFNLVIIVLFLWGCQHVTYNRQVYEEKQENIQKIEMCSFNQFKAPCDLIQQYKDNSYYVDYEFVEITVLQTELNNTEIIQEYGSVLNDLIDEGQISTDEINEKYKVLSVSVSLKNLMDLTLGLNPKYKLMPYLVRDGYTFQDFNYINEQTVIDKESIISYSPGKWINIKVKELMTNVDYQICDIDGDVTCKEYIKIEPNGEVIIQYNFLIEQDKINLSKLGLVVEGSGFWFDYAKVDGIYEWYLENYNNGFSRESIINGYLFPRVHFLLEKGYPIILPSDHNNIAEGLGIYYHPEAKEQLWLVELGDNNVAKYSEIPCNYVCTEGMKTYENGTIELLLPKG